MVSDSKAVRSVVDDWYDSVERLNPDAALITGLLATYQALAPKLEEAFAALRDQNRVYLQALLDESEERLRDLVGEVLMGLTKASDHPEMCGDVWSDEAAAREFFTFGFLEQYCWAKDEFDWGLYSDHFERRILKECEQVARRAHDHGRGLSALRVVWGMRSDADRSSDFEDWLMRQIHRETGGELAGWYDSFDPAWLIPFGVEVPFPDGNGKQESRDRLRRLKPSAKSPSGSGGET